MNSKLHLAWENRASVFGDKKEGVMQQSFPRLLNDYIHNLHMREVLKHLPKDACECLDIGCGYGRVASEIVKANKKAFVHGLDISSVFVKLFNERIGEKGKAVVGDIKDLPFSDNKFDSVVCIVTMMYLKKESEQEKAISEMLRVVKSGGKIILIEPNQLGDNIVKLFGLLPFILRKILRRKKVETFGISFPAGRIKKLVDESGGKIMETRGYPFLAVSLLLIIALSKISKPLAAIFLKVIYLLDSIFPFPRFSHVITYVIEKP